MVNGAAASESICTVSLAEMLVDRHNAMVELLGQFSIQAEKTVGKIVPTTQCTSLVHLQNQLCSYDRNTHLLPLLFSFADQGISLGEGQELSYDFHHISQSLKEILLSVCT